MCVCVCVRVYVCVRVCVCACVRVCVIGSLAGQWGEACVKPSSNTKNRTPFLFPRISTDGRCDGGTHVYCRAVQRAPGPTAS